MSLIKPVVDARWSLWNTHEKITLKAPNQAVPPLPLFMEILCFYTHICSFQCGHIPAVQQIIQCYVVGVELWLPVFFQ